MALSRGECPWCGERLPFRMPLARQVPRGFLEGVGMICPHCDRESHVVVRRRAAAVWWPMAAVCLGIYTYCIRVIYGEPKALGPVLLAGVGAIAATVLAVLAFTAAYRRVKSTAPPRASALVVISKLIAVGLFFGFVTGSWISWFSVAAMMACSLLVEAVFHGLRLAQHGSRGPHEPPAAV